MDTVIKEQDLLAMETRYRAALINSLGGFKSVVMIGSANAAGQPNLTVFSSFFHLGANPALCGIIVRPDVSPRHTLNNILETSSYTINHLNEDIYRQAHQTSARYNADTSEFEACGLTPGYIPGIHAPFVKESHIRFACEFVQRMDIELNGTILMIGKIEYIHLPENAVGQDGFINIEAAGTVTCSGLDSYHTTKRLSRLSYAKPGIAATDI
jgi:flavin reductase (DIM6/NTAB) family NADH-FMN oxidoreductase RutF